MSELDHRMLLPTDHPTIRVSTDDREVTALFESRRWVFPRDECVLLPIKNTTAELIAKYIAGRLAIALRERHQFVPDVLRVEVEEGVGVSAAYEWRA